MKELFLLRHGIAADRETSRYKDDSLRPLTDEGCKKMNCIARGMQALKLDWDRIVASPLLRAKQTAEIVHQTYHQKIPLSFSKHLAPGADAKKLIIETAEAYQRADRILLVGHEPFLSGLIARLISGKEEARIEIKKGGLAKLAVQEFFDGPCASLEWLLTAEQLIQLA